MDRVTRHARKPRFGSLGSLGTAAGAGAGSGAVIKRGRSPSPAHRPPRLPAFPPRRVPLGTVRTRRSSSLAAIGGVALPPTLPIPPAPQRSSGSANAGGSTDYHPVSSAYVRVPRSRSANPALINLSSPAPNDEDGARRLRFFKHRPRPHSDLPADAPAEVLSPFAHLATTMGFGSDSMCAVCGDGEALSYCCLNCGLAFHTACVEGHDGLCGACAAPVPKLQSQSEKNDWNPQEKPHVQGLRALAESTAAGNPTDLVLHPGVLSGGTGGAPRYEADWLRCVECGVLRVVTPGVLAECVRAPFRCSSAFWLPDPKCDAEQPDPSAVEALLTQIAHRPARRRRLFQKMGERHAARFGVSAPVTAPAHPHAHAHAPLPYKARAPSMPELPGMNSMNGMPGLPGWNTGRMAERSPSSDIEMLPISSASPSFSIGAPAPIETSPDGNFDKELARSRILGRIGQLHGLGPLEDTLIDLAISNHPRLLELYRSLWNNPELFNRQVIRLARACDQARSRGGGGGGLPGMSSRMLERHEQAEVFEGFRTLRVRQIGESIRLKQEMMRGARACRVEDLPKQYGRHSQAEQSLLEDHNAQLREFWQMRLRRHGPSL